LICAPYGRDAQSVADLLCKHGYPARDCKALGGLAAALRSGLAGVVLITEEALREDAAELSEVLSRQPEWSDIPFIFLTTRKTGREGSLSAQRVRLQELTSNAIVLERPLALDSLLSATASAIRARRRQFDMRDRMMELAAQAQQLAIRNDALARSESALRESNRRFEAIANSIDQMIWTTWPDGYHDYYNNRWYEFTGTPHGSTDGEAWNKMFHPDDRGRAWTVWHRSLNTGEPYHIEYRLRHHSGEYRWVLGRAQALRDESGEIVRWFGTCTDIHDIVAARELLARSRAELETMVEERTAALETEMASRMRAEASLRQSQKMEAVGQLTGGIAHDFNNMLTGVMGALDIIKRRILTRRLEDVDRFMDAATASAQRAAGLTARLLAFSRRQSLDARPIDVNQLILSLKELLHRSVREDISIDIAAAEELPPAVADANQLENAIINLVINARDAMPQGGRLSIRTSAVELNAADASAQQLQPGQYVVVAVSDTGVGMSAEVLEKAFEPFFTTKPIGQGTGLGLSMIYGFARQSGGQVHIVSTIGVGTTVSICLPAAQQRPSPEPSTEKPTAPEGRGQKVLLVEDDASVRMLVCEVLQELGYVAIEAEEANIAIGILASNRVIDLMISDVGLPGMGGRQLADVARRHRPGLPILFITGYAENAASRADFLGANMAMITKPFDLDALASKISRMLDQ
jgi:PAS domain S-box-containing protein